VKEETRAAGASSVAALLQQIDLEYEAARQGLTGLAQGAARHAWITAWIERMAVACERLVAAVGIEQATILVLECLQDQGSSQEGKTEANER
jgi:hypothetical protein